MIKKVLKLMLLALVPMFSIGSANIVSAESNDSVFSREIIEGVYYYQEDLDTGEFMTGSANIFYMNGAIAYCIEPLVQITDHTYNSTTDWSIVDLTEEQIEYIEKVGYFGYEYSGHQTERYYMATQELIWEKVRNVDAKYTTERGGGDEIDLTAEKEEILNLINNYDMLPSFSDSEIEAEVGDEIVLTDDNGVLNQFEIDYDGTNKITINDNQLSLNLTEEGEETIKFVKKNYDDQVNLIYYKEGSQTLATLRISNQLTFELTLKVDAKSVEVVEEEETTEQIIVVEVPDTFKDKNIGIEIVAITMILSGVIMILYASKKKKVKN